MTASNQLAGVRKISLPVQSISDPALLGVGENAGVLRQRVRSFIDKEVIPLESHGRVRDVNELDCTIAELQRKAKAGGIWGPRIKAEFGGLDLNWRDAHAILEEAGRSFLGPGALHCAPPDGPNLDLLDVLASGDQKVRYLEPLSAGQIRSCFAMTEPAPGAGSDPRMLRTRAERRDGSWMINGKKWFVSGAEGATFAIVMAATDAGPTLFLVDTRNPGWTLVRRIPSLDGSQIGGHGEITLHDCIVPDEAVLGEIGRGFDYAQRRLEPARLAHCMRLVGRAVRATEIVQDYVMQRDSFGQRLSEYGTTQSMIADTHIELSAARLMTWHVAALLDAGQSIAHDSAMTKVFVSEAAYRAIDRAVQLTGALGISHDQPLADFFQEIRAFRIFDGASEVHRGSIARRVLKNKLRP